MEKPILSMKNISKSFPGVKALMNVDLEVHQGEVLALVGENGAGKSTLIKILSGDYVADSGEIDIDGTTIGNGSPQDAIAQGIGVIYQELNSADYLTVAENIYMGHLPHNRFGIIDKKSLQRDTRSILDRVGLFKVKPSTLLKDLSIAEKQMVEIAKAISHNVKVLIMDEPTASLNEEEIEILFSLVRKMSDAGTAIIYISHRLDEVFQISDNILVLRDGKRVTQLVTSETDKSTLITHMVGRVISEMYPQREGQFEDKVILQVTGLQTNYIKDVSFEVRKGEVLGLFGLMGSGRTEIVETIIGDRKKKSGDTIIREQSTKIRSPEDAKKLGIGYLPSDRKAEGLFLIHPVGDNISINILERLKGLLGTISKHKNKSMANEWVEKLNIKTPSISTLAMSLSGGNQQKIVVAKWLAATPEILILNDPTRGIDVGAKTEIYRLINQLSQQGLSLIVISSELPELMSLADRIVVIHEGAQKGILHRNDFSQERLLQIALGGEENEH